MTGLSARRRNPGSQGELMWGVAPQRFPENGGPVIRQGKMDRNSGRRQKSQPRRQSRV